MIFQTVNLYCDELKSKKLNYSALLLVQLSLFIFVVLLVITGFSSFQLDQQQVKLNTIKNTQKLVMVDFKKLQAELSKRKKDITLSQKIKDKTTELTNKQRVLRILSQDEFGNTKGFVEHVIGLARQRIDGLWLTKIRIENGGANIELSGVTSSPSLLPRYLQRLSAEKIFVGTEFKSLKMVRQNNNKQWLDFSLKSKVDVNE